MNDENTTVTAPAPGSWQEALAKSSTLLARSGKARQQASALLWEGGQTAIEEWLDNSDTDVHAEVLYADVLDALGKPRKGDASKIKSVALAVKNNGLVLAQFPNLSKAYAEANRLTKTVAQQATEDTAADEAVQAIQAPKTTGTPEGAAALVMSQGVDEAARLLLDALGVTNTAAHRAFMRAISQEIAGRIPKPAPKPAAKKATAKKATAKKATVGDGASKPKPAAKGAATAKAKPVAKAAKPKPAAAVTEQVEEPVDAEVEEPTAGDLFEDIDGETEVEAPVESKPKPVRKGVVRR